MFKNFHFCLKYARKRRCGKVYNKVLNFFFRFNFYFLTLKQNNYFQMKTKNLIVVAFIALVGFSCSSKYAKVKIKDANNGDSYVYGEIDGPAKQLKNKYADAKPETVEKANAFRAKVESALVSHFGAK